MQWQKIFNQINLSVPNIQGFRVEGVKGLRHWLQLYLTPSNLILDGDLQNPPFLKREILTCNSSFRITPLEKRGAGEISKHSVRRRPTATEGAPL
jgi:hypothetical protein